MTATKRDLITTLSLAFITTIEYKLDASRSVKFSPIRNYQYVLEVYLYWRSICDRTSVDTPTSVW